MKKVLFSLCLIFLMVGCVNVPMTTISVPTEHGMVRIEAPKDSRIAGLKANFEKGTLTLDSYEARMNPDVIGASALGQVELIKAYGDLSAKLADIGLRSFAASQGFPLAGPAPAPQPTHQPNNMITTDQLNQLIQQRAEALNASRAAQATNQPPVARRGPRVRPGATNAPPVVNP